MSLQKSFFSHSEKTIVSCFKMRLRTFLRVKAFSLGRSFDGREFKEHEMWWMRYQ